MQCNILGRIRCPVASLWNNGCKKFSLSHLVWYMCRHRCSARCISSLLSTALVTCWRRFPAISTEWRFHVKLITVITFEPRTFSSIPMLILFPTSSAFCWYLTLVFQWLIVPARHKQWILEPYPCICSLQHSTCACPCSSEAFLPSFYPWPHHMINLATCTRSTCFSILQAMESQVRPVNKLVASINQMQNVPWNEYSLLAYPSLLFSGCTLWVHSWNACHVHRLLRLGPSRSSMSMLM